MDVCNLTSAQLEIADDMCQEDSKSILGISGDGSWSSYSAFDLAYVIKVGTWKVLIKVEDTYSMRIYDHSSPPSPHLAR